MFSIALNHLIEKLENRAAKDSIASKCRYKRKERVEKSPSKCSVPSNAPKWTIKSSAIATAVRPSVVTTAVTSAVVTTPVTTAVSPSVTTAIGTPVASDDTPHRKGHKEAQSSRRFLDFLMSSEDSLSSSSDNS